jgi:glycosyltransferase involved in cell wall biosynthesis
MNILVLTHSYPDINLRWRGTFIQEQVRALGKEHSVIVVYFKVNYSHFSPFANYSFTKTINGNITEFIVTISKSFPVITQLKYLSNTFRFINNEILKQIKPDIIHSHLAYPAGFLGTIIQKRKKIPNVLTEHTWISKYFRSWIHKQCVLYTLKNAAGVISVSNALKDNIGIFCKRSISVIPNVIDDERFRISKREKTGPINIGILGGMGNFRKGLDILMKSVSLLNDKDFLLHIGGDGQLLGHFKKMAKDLNIEDRCKFYGELQPSEIPEFYSSVDIFVLASRDETFGVVVIEAMACGIPVIATKCGGPEEIITEDSGILVEKEDPEALARAISFMSENIGSYNSDLIRKYASEKYGERDFVENITKLYRQLLM